MASHGDTQTSVVGFREKLMGAIRLTRVERFLRMEPHLLRQHQLDSLNRILARAVRAEPYRSLYSSVPRLERLEDLSTLPIVERRHLAAFPEQERVTEAAPELDREPSTGTSGEVLVTLRTPDENQYQSELAARQFHWQGVPVDTPHLHLLFGIDPEGPLAVRDQMGILSGQATVETQAEVLRSFQPSFISGPPSVLLELGEYMGGFPVKALMTLSEILTPTDRKQLQRYFGVDPFDLYATSEAGLISWECRERSGYHVNADAVLIEVLDDDDEPVPVGERGHLVITTLWNPTMPAIRYRIGDIGTLSPDICPCGISLPLMEQVEGRVNDCPVAFDGRRISPLRLTLGGIGQYHSEVIRFRIVQRAVDDLLMEIIWRDEPIPDFERKATDAYSRALGGPVRVEVREVNRISTPRGRKFRWVESLIE